MNEISQSVQSITREDVVAVISVLAFVLSLSSWAHAFITQRRKLSFRITEAKSNNEVSIIYILIENRSRLPVSVTRISLVTERGCVDCVLIPELVLESKRTRGGQLIDKHNYFSMEMPISISSLGAASGFLLFRGEGCMIPKSSTSVTLKVCTNRGRAFQMTIPLPQDDR